MVCLCVLFDVECHYVSDEGCHYVQCNVLFSVFLPAVSGLLPSCQCSSHLCKYENASKSGRKTQLSLKLKESILYPKEFPSLALLWLSSVLVFSGLASLSTETDTAATQHVPLSQYRCAPGARGLSSF